MLRAFRQRFGQFTHVLDEQLRGRAERAFLQANYEIAVTVHLIDSKSYEISALSP